MNVTLLRKGVDFSEKSLKTDANSNCEEHGGHCCATGYCCEKP